MRLLLPLLLCGALAHGPAPADEPPELPATVRARTPSAACAAFLPQDRPHCARRLAEHDQKIAALEARRAEAPPERACLLRCDVLEEGWRLERDTRAWTRAAVRYMAGGGYERRNAELERQQAVRLAVKAERDGLAAEVAELKEQAPSAALAARIAEKEGRLVVLEARLLAAGHAGNSSAGEPPTDPSVEREVRRMHASACSQEEADAWLAACRERCRGRAPSAVRECPL